MLFTDVNKKAWVSSLIYCNVLAVQTGAWTEFKQQLGSIAQLLHYVSYKDTLWWIIFVGATFRKKSRYDLIFVTATRSDRTGGAARVIVRTQVITSLHVHGACST